MDFGAGTGLICSKIAPQVERVFAVDISESMLEKLSQKEELLGKVEIKCQDILDTPLSERFGLIVSAMALHHVRDTRAALSSFFDHLIPGGELALADLDSEEGDFHPEGIEGVFHHGFDRPTLGRLAEEVGFIDVSFETATTVHKGEKTYSIFLITAHKPK
jgi:2-polyprenyl-3-methyl-5-hydroxy-6-metoxy-1,4-benzoquinol methylase